MPEIGHEAATVSAAATERIRRMQTAIAPFVTRRLAGWWGLRCYPDLRNGQQTPHDIAAESEDGLNEVLGYIERVGPQIKGTDWSGSGWVGKGRKKPRK